MGPRTGRVVGFLVVTLMWVVLVAGTFMSNSHRTQTSGSPMGDLDQRLEDKIFLASMSPSIRPFSGMEEASAPYRQRARAPSQDVAASCRLIVVLVQMDRRQEAFDQAEKLADLPRGDDPAVALKDAFGLGTPRPGKQPLPSQVVRRDEAALREHLGGWQLSAALSALMQHAGHAQEAQIHQAELEQAQSQATWQLLLVAAVIVIEVIAGLVVCLAFPFTLRARARARREAVPSLEHGLEQAAAFPGKADFDPLLGWCMGLAWSVATIVVGISVFALISLAGANPRQVTALLGGQFMVYGIMVVLIGLLVRSRWYEVGVRSRVTGQDLATGLAAFVAAVVVVMTVSLALQKLTQEANPSNNPIFEFLRQMDGSRDTILMLVFVGLVGPLFEELLFRGVIYTSMRQVMGAAVAVPLNGLIFSAVHGDVNGLIPLAVLGAILAYVYERTRSIWATTLTHGLWNAQTFAATVIFYS